MITHGDAVDETRDQLAPDDHVGNALCDALLESPDPSLIRVVNYHGDWAEAIPDARDFIRSLNRCSGVVAQYLVDGPDAVSVLFRSADEPGHFERVRVDGHDAISDVASVTSRALVDCHETYAGPRLVPLDDYRFVFGIEDGDGR